MSDDGSVLASGSHDKTVRLWDIVKGECIQVMREHTHYIECLAFSPATLTTLETDVIITTNQFNFYLFYSFREKHTKENRVLEIFLLLDPEINLLKFGKLPLDKAF
jgi:WD40 repeat protein